MRSAWEQTLGDMKSFGVTVQDIAWIGARPCYDGRPATVGLYTEEWREFAAWAEREAPLALDGLVMVLRDGRWLEAEMADVGRVCEWTLRAAPQPPQQRVPFPSQ